MTRLLDYAGATGRILLSDACKLDRRRWRFQRKQDGAYARITTSATGRIAHVLARSGLPLAAARDLVGIDLGVPHSVIAAEHESCTEAGVRAATARGFAMAHLFDCTRLDGRDLTREPYLDRWGALHRAASWAETEGRSRRHDWTPDGQGDAHDRTGRYCRAVPQDWRRFEIVPLHRNPEELWAELERDDAEGMVAVDTGAPLGARLAKRKCKRQLDLDAVVVAVDRRAAILSWRGHTFVVSAAGRCRPAVGELWAVLIDGFHEGARVVPRHPRLIRRRDDLQPESVTP